MNASACVAALVTCLGDDTGYKLQDDTGYKRAVREPGYISSKCRMFRTDKFDA